ncbi:EAL domain-containing protein [Jeotgalibacillus sp. JSM ZJ347]|uniref:EAL domain-containing protein n=1 Tax=Jeotgalibacillus sp. JSM ZJ347 TaxID=3342117 RepID=UPI0035A9047D
MEHYNVFLVICSILIAIISSYAALLIVKSMTQTDRTVIKRLSLVFGSVIFGSGIWCMHFVAMLALHTGFEVSYDPLLLILSIVFAALSSSTAFILLSRPSVSNRQLIYCALFISAGILSMHYVGMEAMEMNAMIEYNPLLVFLSGMIAIVTSFAALKIFIYFSRQSESSLTGPMISAVIMGIAIAGMHYTGMASATFTQHEAHSMTLNGTGLRQDVLGYLIVIIMFIILSFVFVVLFFEQKIRQTNRNYSISDKIYRSLIYSANDAVITADQSGKILSWNRAAERIFGYQKEEALNQPLTLIMPDRYAEAHQQGMKRYAETAQKVVIDQTVELEGQHKNGHIFPIELSLSSIKDHHQQFFTGIIRDITDRVKQQKKIEELVYKDPLTHLPNRRMLLEELDRILNDLDQAHAEVAVAFIDMDRFKQINDIYGHETGDELLKLMAKRINHLTDSKDLFGRQSGDEFIIISPDCSPYQMSVKVNKMIEAFQDSFLINQTEIFISPSIGISLFPKDGTTAAELIKQADMAMYKAKELGRNQFQFYTKALNEEVLHKLKVEYGLRNAILNHELEIYYQPLVYIHTNQVKGVEALLRWNSPELGFVSPGDFIPLAEENQQIIPIGEWVLENACIQFMKWANEGHIIDHMSVNISAVQFQQPDFAEMVGSVLHKTGMPPSKLVLEVTETVIQDVNHSLPTLNRLKDMGVKLSLDDFGTGYSSLQYLKDFPLSILKIDMSFIRSLLSDKRNQIVVNMIINMAEELNMEVVAEGVETENQRAYLANRNSLYYQGYLYSPPVSNQELVRLLERGRISN